MVDRPSTTEYVAECFWPGVDEVAVRALDARTGGSAEALARAGYAPVSARFTVR
jgi:hypothetical protein